MKIVLFTSTQPSWVDILNMNSLKKEMLDHEFYTIAIQPKVSRKTTKFTEIRKRWGEFRQNNQWEKDKRKVFAELQEKWGRTFCKEYKIDETIEHGCNSLQAQEAVKRAQPDMMLQCGGSLEILKPAIYTIPKYGTINVHHGIAPEVRGVYSYFWPLYYGLSELLGVTVHFIDEGIDTGVVITQYQWPQSSAEFKKVYVELIEKGTQMLSEAVKFISENKGQWKIKETSTKSYYFSYKHFLNKDGFKAYNSLKRNNFRAMESPDNLPYKILPKKYIVK